MQKRFDFISTLASLVGAAVGAAIVALCHICINMTTVEGKCVWTGLFFSVIFLCGFIGMQISFAFKKKYKIHQRLFLNILLAILAAGLMFLSGAQGQYLFMQDTETVETVTEIEGEADPVDMVILLDSSSSMIDFEQGRNQAACAFVDTLSEETRLRVVSFASVLEGASSDDLIKMTDKNKDIVKDFINNSGLVGLTNFNLPLSDAFTCLENNARDDAKKAVILLTDGEAGIDDTIYDDYVDSDISLYSIRISAQSDPSILAKKLIDLAEDTGGFDRHLKPNSQGNVDTDEMIDAFREIFEAQTSTSTSTTTKKVMNDDLLPFSEDEISKKQTTIRAVVIIICACLAYIGYFGKLSVLDIIVSIIGGIVYAIVAKYADGAGMIVAFIFYILLAGTAFVTIELNGADEYDV
ncbi:MAG: VWA domain-containing protein [Clostridia bacterium]|nr:VWA domain-containing protein [Clostridia bacterium]